MRIYVLILQDQSRLEGAAAVVMEDDRVGSCSVERERLRLRFLAPRHRADQLVERIYADGGLVWCSRHDLAPTASGPRRVPAART